MGGVHSGIAVFTHASDDVVRVHATAFSTRWPLVATPVLRVRLAIPRAIHVSLEIESRIGALEAVLRLVPRGTSRCVTIQTAALRNLARLLAALPPGTVHKLIVTATDVVAHEDVPAFLAALERLLVPNVYISSPTMWRTAWGALCTAWPIHVHMAVHTDGRENSPSWTWYRVLFEHMVVQHGTAFAIADVYRTASFPTALRPQQNNAPLSEVQRGVASGAIPLVTTHVIVRVGDTARNVSVQRARNARIIDIAVSAICATAKAAPVVMALDESLDVWQTLEAYGIDDETLVHVLCAI